MKVCRCFSLLFLCSLLHTGVFAGVFKGKVTDEQGRSLPYATIYLEGTTTGTNANGDGYYELVVQPGLYKVVCQYVGYKQSAFNATITGSETIEHNFVLKDMSLEMKEVVVHSNAEDPAYEIIRNAIKKRKFHLDQIKSFQTGIYFKGVIRSRQMPKKFLGKEVLDETDAVDSSGKGVLYLAEENADYCSTGDKSKTVIHSVHESGNASGLGFSQFPPVITFYENNVNVMGKDSRGFISPVSENALFYYKYKLQGQFNEGGHTIYKIGVTQKRLYEPCFNGTIYIVDDEWAIHSLNMTLVKQSGIDMVDTLTIDQLYLPFEKGSWVIKSQVMYFALKIFVFDMTGSFVSVYNGQKVNQTIPDSVFANKVISQYDKQATKKDSSYWNVARPIPLQKDERDNFIAKDSLSKRYSTPGYLDSARRKENKLKPLALLTSGYTYNTKKYKNKFSINQLLLGPDNMVNYNTVEGFNVAPKLHWRHLLDTGKNLHGDLAVRYGFANEHLNAIGRLYYVLQDKAFLSRTWALGLEGGKYVFQYNSENPVSEWLNSYSALFYRENDFKIYERWEGAFYLAHNHGTGLRWHLRASYQQRLPLENTTTYSFIDGGKEGFKANAPLYLTSQATAWQQNDAALVEAVVSYQPGYSYLILPDRKAASGSNWPVFTLTYKKGIPGIANSVSDYDKLRFSIKDELKLRLLGNLSYNIAVGGFLNSKYVSVPDLMHLYGNRGIGVAAPYLESFQMAPFYDFSNKEQLYGEAHLEYHMRGMLSNKIPIFRQLRWFFLLGGNAFYANDNNYYTEAFAGVDNMGYKLARVVRVDFVQSWDSRMGHNSGVRASINLSFTQTTKKYPLHGEW